MDIGIRPVLKSIGVSGYIASQGVSLPYNSPPVMQYFYDLGLKD